MAKTVGNTTGQPNDLTVATGAGAVDGDTQRLTLASDDPAVASLGVIDDWDESDRAKTNIIVGQAGVAAGTGVDGVTVPRVTLATNVGLPAGTNNIGDVDVLTLPTLGATHGVYAEDTGHTTADLGRFVLAVRTDTPAARATTDADYIPFITDAIGLQWVRQPPRFRSIWYDLVTQAAAFAALDQLADEVELTSMALVAGGGGIINNMVLVSNNLTIISAELWLYQINPTAAGTNAVHDQSDANNESSRPFGVIDFNSWRTTTSNMQSSGTYMGIPLMTAGLGYQCLDGTLTTSLWGILMTRTIVTPGATTDYNLMVTHTAGV